jgi:hypothetical protein
MLALGGVALHPTGSAFKVTLADAWHDHAYAVIAALVLAGWLLTSISVFLNAALVFCALRALAGETPSVRAGLAAATARLPQILGWALIATLVGGLVSVIQEQLKDKLGFLGDVAGGLFDFAWAALTYFVLPVLVVEDVGPIRAVKRSTAILRQTWGEAVVGSAGIGVIGIPLVLPAIVAVVVAIFLASTGAAAVLFAIAILYGIAVLVLLGTLGTIFRSAVYVFAATGQAALDEGLLREAFRPKPARKTGVLKRWFGR